MEHLQAPIPTRKPQLNPKHEPSRDQIKAYSVFVFNFRDAQTMGVRPVLGWLFVHTCCVFVFTHFQIVCLHLSY